MKKNTIYTFILLAVVISVFSLSSIQMFGWDDDEAVVVYSDYGYIYTNIPQYFAETSTTSAPAVNHYATVAIYKNGSLAASDTGDTGTSSYAYASTQPAMPNDNFSTEHGYVRVSK